MSEKKSSGQFKESESGLRDVSYDEGVTGIVGADKVMTK